MKGFFTGRDLSRKKRQEKQKIRKERKQVSSDPCEICGLYKNCKSPKMGYTGEGRKGILNIVEAPDKTEDRKGQQLVGEVGILYKEYLAKYGIDLHKDCYTINVVNCRPPEDRSPSDKEIKNCKSRVDKVIEELQPKFIILHGGVAVKSFYRDRFKNEYLEISMWRKRCIPDKFTGAWVIPLYPVSYVLKTDNDLTRAVYDRDIKWAVSCLNKKPPVFNENDEERVEIILDSNGLLSLFDTIESKPRIITYDYETSGLKPYREGHKIYSISVEYEDMSYSFPYQYPHWSQEEFEEIERRWQQILLNPMIKKVAQGVKFEASWSSEIVGAIPEGWFWDTQVASHVLEEGRPKSTSLDLQVYWRWGVEGYGKEVDGFKQDKDGSGFNTLYKVPLEKLLLYGGLDSLYTGRLYNDQMREFKRNEDLKRAYDLSFAGILAFIDTERDGICCDEDYYKEQDILLGKRIEDLTEELIHGEEGQLFKKKTGRELKLKSNTKDLQILFFDILKTKKTVKTKTGYSVSEPNIKKLNVPFGNKLLELRKIDKVRGTYLSQFLRYSFNGKLHPSMGLSVARTYRSNSDMPNLHNIPVRDKESKKICRGGIIPRPGNKLAELDYSGIEVGGMACCSKDPVLMKEVLDPNSDMHRDQAAEILFLSLDQAKEYDFRQIGKNGFVFPEFYGDWYRSCALAIWEDIENLKVGDKSVYEHLADNGITSYEKFENHMQFVENKFWGLLEVSDHWRKEIIKKEFIDKGFVPTFFGYRRSGFLSRKHLMNTPVQNLAFCCLLWSYIKINEIRKSERWRTKILGQIHDSIILDLHPDEEKHVLQVCKKIMCEDIRKEFSFLIVPFSIDIEMTEIDQPWNTKKKVENAA